MKREELISKLGSLAIECEKDFPVVSGMLHAICGALAEHKEGDLAVHVRKWIKDAYNAILGKLN